MKTLRILLQLVIVGLGGLTLAALISPPTADPSTILVFSVFVSFLLALTFALKEHTEKRLNPSRKLSYKPMGIALLLLGAFGIFYAFGYLTGTHTLPDGSGRCRAICGLILIATQSFGEVTGRLVAFGLWSALGLFLGFVGYKIKDVQTT